MRTLNECKDEILRRSEHRLKERRKARRRMLACCVPLCVCFVICSAAVLPAILDANVGCDQVSEDPPAITNGYAVVEIGSTKDADGQSAKVTDAAEIARLLELIDSSFQAADEQHKENTSSNGCRNEAADSNLTDLTESSMPASSSGNSIPVDQRDQADALKGPAFTVTFSTNSGEQLTYIITENEILNSTVNQKVVLTGEQGEILLSKISNLIQREMSSK